MRDPNRIPKLLSLIEKEWAKNPDLRLCQLLANVSVELRHGGWDLFYLEDDKLIEHFEENGR